MTVDKASPTSPSRGESQALRTSHHIGLSSAQHIDPGQGPQPLSVLAPGDVAGQAAELPPLLRLPPELLLLILMHPDLSDRDVMNVNNTSHAARHLVGGDVRLLTQMVRSTNILLNTDNALALHRRIHMFVNNSEIRRRVMHAFQDRLVLNWQVGSITDAWLEGVREVLADNASKTPDRRFDFAKLEHFYVESRLCYDWHMNPEEFQPIDEFLESRNLGFQISDKERVFLERSVMEEPELREALDTSDPVERRANNFIDRLQIKTPEGMNAAELLVCDAAMPAGRAALEGHLRPDVIATDYGIRADAPGAPNPARQQLRILASGSGAA